MKSSFFNSVNYDRVYSAEDWADYFKRFIGNGVYAQPDTGMQIVSDGGMGIKCLDGSCFINGYTGAATEIEDKLTLEIGDVLYGRIDAVVARLDLNKRDIHIEVIQGLPAETPEKPEHLRTAMIFDLVLAYVTVGVGVTEITDADIEDVRADEALCGFVKGVVEQIETGELFRQYAKEWALLMAGVGLDEPAIIEAFNALNSVRSVNGILPVEGNVEIPTCNIITGSYTGNGLEFSDAITLYGTDTPVFPISPVETTNDTVINIGATPKVVIIGLSTNLEESINNDTQYIITRDMPYRSTSPSSYKDLTTQKNSYVIQINGNPFNKTMTFQQSADSNQKIKYHFWAEQARLEVVSDDVEPTETQIRKSDLQEELLLNEIVNSSSKITGIEIKSVDDVVVGQYVIKAVCNQVVGYSFRTTTKIVEGGFAVSVGYSTDRATNGADLTYGFVALC